MKKRLSQKYHKRNSRKKLHLIHLRYIGVIFLLSLLSLVALGLIFLRSRQSSSNQVYLFISHRQGKAVPKAVLIKSAVENKDDRLVFFNQAEGFDLPKSGDLEAMKAEMSGALQLPIDQLVVVGDFRGGKVELLKSLVARSNLPFLDKLSLLRLLVFSSVTDLKKEEMADLSELFLERSIMQSGKICSVAVINTTEINGLASKLSQFLEQNGVYVTRASGNDQDLEKSYILLDKERKDCLPLAQKLEAILPYTQEIAFDKVLPYYRANVVIFLGKDMGNYLRPN